MFKNSGLGFVGAGNCGLRPDPVSSRPVYGLLSGRPSRPSGWRGEGVPASRRAVLLPGRYLLRPLDHLRGAVTGVLQGLRRQVDVALDYRVSIVAVDLQDNVKGMSPVYRDARVLLPQVAQSRVRQAGIRIEPDDVGLECLLW